MRKFVWELWEPPSRTAFGGDSSCDPEVGGWPASGGRNELSVDWSVAIS
ncbi:MAG: hypothetical protein SPD54_06825 [Parabacteroides sp.]|nr:hypothetical protein [Parabacteroides sp.]